MSLRHLSPRQIAIWSDDIFRAALEERPLPAGHPISWEPLRTATGGHGSYDGPVFSDPCLPALPGGAA